jgi:hypothetical protein
MVAQTFKNPTTVMGTKDQGQCSWQSIIVVFKHRQTQWTRHFKWPHVPLEDRPGDTASAAVAAVTQMITATSENIVLYATQPQKPNQRLAFYDVLAPVLFSLLLFVVNVYAFNTICAYALLPSQNQIRDCHYRE